MKKIKKSLFFNSIQLLSQRDQRRLTIATSVQIFLSLMDLIGVALIGILGALSVSGLQSKNPGNRVSKSLKLLQINNFSFQNQLIAIALMAVMLLLGRTILSIIFTRRILYFLSMRGAAISSKLTTSLLSKSILFVQSRTSQETLFALTRGVEMIVLQILATAAFLLSDFATLIVIGVGLLIVDPTTAFSSMIVFGIVGLLLYKYMHIKVSKIGEENSRKSIQSNEKIIEVLSSYRELFVHDRMRYYSNEIKKFRYSLSNNSAELSFVPYVSKYVIEATVLLGALGISFISLILQDVTHAVATMSIFLAAGTRIAPALLRIQQGLIQIRIGIGQAAPTFDLIESIGELEKKEIFSEKKVSENFNHENFVPSIVVRNVTFVYPENKFTALSNVDFEIKKGEVVAFVGSSGAGKTTLIDVILGILNTNSGSVTISGRSPSDAIKIWPGAISYVPQEVNIIAGTIRENICLGYPIEYATDELVINSLRVAQLHDFIASLPEGLESKIGERGVNLSGGQRQRLGIARAVFSKPKLLVLDEATSSLDGETEAHITSAIQNLKGNTTIIMIAHRLSTVRHADSLVYLEKGVCKFKGTFDEVRRNIPDFEKQAQLMGL